ncbi:MAG TPA: twin-arginine translocase TatA/TatE family subunit [Candidatus Saccharimonas sp.]|nr:twin-arginine translocase TatA/TatE family subunit [Candidatus Saccharimonas sp.]
MFGKFETLLVVLVIILILFGAKKLPELSRGISESVREIRKGFRDEPTADKPAADGDAAKAKDSQS